MLRRAWMPLVVLLVLTQGVAAATDPGARDPITLGAGTVNDVALADENWLAFATQDPSGRISVPPAPSADVWELYNLVGGVSRQAGDADIDACDSGTATFDDCQSHATHVAISADGTRLVVASMADDGNPILTFVRESSGPLNAVRSGLAGTVQDLAMSDDGQTIVLLTNTGTAAPTGHVYLYNWASGASTNPSLLWSDDLSGGAVGDVGLAPDGQSLAVTQGSDHHRYRRASNAPRTDVNFAGNANDVAVANGAQHIGVAASSDGWLYFYTDDTPANSADLRFREVSSSMEAVAISDDGTLVVAGNAAGDLWAYTFDPELLRTTTVRKVSLGSPVQEIALADDGKTVAIAHVGSVSHYAIEATTLVKLWSQTLTASSGDIAIDGNGDRVAATNGTGVRLFDAIHQVALSPGATPTVAPGNIGAATLTFTNQGNRVEGGSLAVEAPSGWTATLNSTSLRILPEGFVTVRVDFAVPARQPAGPHSLNVLSNLGPAGTRTTALQVTVPSIESYSLEADGPTSLGLKAGQSNAFTLKVANTGNVAGTPALTASIQQQGWTATLAGNDGPLAPGDERVVTVTVTAPAGAPDGTQAQAVVTAPKTQGSPLTLFATVGATFGVSLDGPAAVDGQPGALTTLTLTVRNLGNAPDVYMVDVGTLPAGWLASVRPSMPGVGAGASADVTVDLTIPSGATASSPIEITFTAQSSGDATKVQSHEVLVRLPQPETSTTSSSTGGKGAPSLAPALLGLAVIALAAWRRR